MIAGVGSGPSQVDDTSGFDRCRIGRLAWGLVVWPRLDSVLYNVSFARRLQLGVVEASCWIIVAGRCTRAESVNVWLCLRIDGLTPDEHFLHALPFYLTSTTSIASTLVRSP